MSKSSMFAAFAAMVLAASLSGCAQVNQMGKDFGAAASGLYTKATASVSSSATADAQDGAATASSDAKAKTTAAALPRCDRPIGTAHVLDQRGWVPSVQPGDVLRELIGQTGCFSLVSTKADFVFNPKVVEEINENDAKSVELKALKVGGLVAAASVLFPPLALAAAAAPVGMGDDVPSTNHATLSVTGRKSITVETNAPSARDAVIAAYGQLVARLR